RRRRRPRRRRRAGRRAAARARPRRRGGRVAARAGGRAPRRRRPARAPRRRRARRGGSAVAVRPLADVLRRDPDARRMAAFAVLLFAGMWLSKTAQPLYFDAYGALGRFGVSYTVMALAGISTAVTGGIVDRVGPATALRGGAALYALGLLLRLDHVHVVVAATS